MTIRTLVGRRTSTDHPLLIIERILRDRESVWRQIKAEYNMNTLILHLLISTTLALVCYGAVMGCLNGLQALSSAIKLPILFLLTLAICLPTLYLFNLVFGARLSVRQALALVLVAITVTSVLTLAFAPISLFFRLTALNYSFIKILNVSILALTGFIGLGFLTGGMRSMNAQPFVEQATEPQDAPSEETTEPFEVVGVSAGRPVRAHKPVADPRQVSTGLLNIWIILYSFVGTQLAWTLRPFFGDPKQGFEIFRQLEGNFYVNVVKTLMHLFN
jgi:lysylphosphatidylglycerol synthetase-like protein (DUF2156 family)